MIKWIAKIDWGKTFLAGVVYLIAATLIRQIEATLTIGFYKDPLYFGTWSKLMMPQAGPPPVNFFITSVVMTLVSGVSLAVVYYYIKDLLPKPELKRTLLFADLLVGLNFLFFTLPVYLMFNVPLGLLASWFISSFIILVIAAFADVKLLK